MGTRDCRAVPFVGFDVDAVTFIQMHGFSEDWDGLGLTMEDLRSLEMAIMERP